MAMSTCLFVCLSPGASQFVRGVTWHQLPLIRGATTAQLSIDHWRPTCADCVLMDADRPGPGTGVVFSVDIAYTVTLHKRVQQLTSLSSRPVGRCIC